MLSICTLLWQSLNVTSFMMLHCIFAHVSRLGVSTQGSKSGFASGQVLNTFQLSTNSITFVVGKFPWVVKSSCPFPLKFPHKPQTPPCENITKHRGCATNKLYWGTYIIVWKCQCKIWKTAEHDSWLQLTLWWGCRMMRTVVLRSHKTVSPMLASMTRYIPTFLSLYLIVGPLPVSVVVTVPSESSSQVLCVWVCERS